MSISTVPFTTADGCRLSHGALCFVKASGVKPAEPANIAPFGHGEAEQPAKQPIKANPKQQMTGNVSRRTPDQLMIGELKRTKAVMEGGSNLLLARDKQPTNPACKAQAFVLSLGSPTQLARRNQVPQSHSSSDLRRVGNRTQHRELQLYFCTCFVGTWLVLNQC